jgi:nicotinate dehydrogenase subunit A
MTQFRPLMINGSLRQTRATGDTPLLDILRSELCLMTARFGCGAEACGACMVLIDGSPAYACTLAIDTLGDKAITTLEGLGTPEHPNALQQAFIDEQAGQCGYCLSGIMISAKALLDRNPRPTLRQIAAALDKHLCRCGAHNRFIRAVERAAMVIANGAKAQ